MPKSKTTPPRETKAAILRKLLALQSAMGWQPHSVRAALSGLRKAGYIIDRTDPAKPGGTATYRITGRAAGAQ